MWFKQVQLLQLSMPIQSSAQALIERIEGLAFQPCLPSMPLSAGWVSPIEDDAPLAVAVNGCIMLCLQIEEKILPASVVNQAMKDKVKRIEAGEARKVRSKEKMNLKEDITHTLLPRAFSKLTRIFAYVDTRNGWLVLNCISPSKTELFMTTLKKSLGDCVEGFDIIKPSSIITEWLKNKNYPQTLAIQKSCILRDPEQQNRVIRCQEQDLFAGSIQSLVKDGCEAIQIALCWYDRLDFTIADDFSLRSIRLADDDLVDLQDDIETKQQKFAADFVLMSEMFTGLFTDLLGIFTRKNVAVAA